MDAFLKKYNLLGNKGRNAEGLRDFQWMKYACRMCSVLKAEGKTCRNIRSFGDGVDRRRRKRQIKYRYLDDTKSELCTSRINGVLKNGKSNLPHQTLSGA